MASLISPFSSDLSARRTRRTLAGRRPRLPAHLRRRISVLVCGALIGAFWLAIGGPATGGPADAAAAAATDTGELASLREKYRRPSAAEGPQHTISVSSIVLGSKLFVEKSLSLNATISCASCHDPQTGWADHKAKPLGDRGILAHRRAPTLIGMAWLSSYGWDGRHPTLEDMVLSPISNHDEMNLTIDGAVTRLAESPVYGKLFALAFPAKGVSAETIAQSLANFLRSRRLPETRFDKWVEGDDGALSAAEKRGFLVFNGTAHCDACHSGWRFTDDGFRDIGLADDSDPGRGAILPQIEGMAHAFKTPTLRSVAERAPYMHDGSLKSLEDVIAHYEKGGVRRPSLSPEMPALKLTAGERSDLLAFLQSLSPDSNHPKRE